MMDCVGIELFVAVAGGATLAKAAQRLRITPMSATRRLAALERELGVRLVHRTTRAIALTAEGLAFLPHAHRLIVEHAAARASVRAGEDGPSGRLRLTSSVAFGRRIVAPLLVELLREHPAVSAELLMTDSVVDLVAEGLDLAVRIADLADNRLIARRLAPNPRELVATRAYLDQAGSPRTLDELGEHDCLAITGTGHWTFLADQTPVRHRIEGRFTANSIDGLRAACLGGAGIANLSAWFVRDDLARGALVRVRLADATPQPLSIWAVYASQRLLPPRTRVFVDALARRLRDWCAPDPAVSSPVA